MIQQWQINTKDNVYILKKSGHTITVSQSSGIPEDIQETLVSGINEVIQQQELWHGLALDTMPRYMQEWIKDGVSEDQKVIINRWVLEKAFAGDISTTSHLHVASTDKPDELFIIGNSKNIHSESDEHAKHPQNYALYDNFKRRRKWWVIATLCLTGILFCYALWTQHSNIPSWNYPEVISLNYNNTNPASSQVGQIQAEIKEQTILVTQNSKQISLPAQLSKLKSLALSTSGKYLAEFSEDDQVALWELESQQPIASTWKIHGLDSEKMLYSISVYKNFIYAVGDGVALRSSDGKSWLYFEGIENYKLRALYNAGDRLWAVGLNGVILYNTAGDVWQRVSHDSQEHLYAIAGNSSSIFAVGANGTVLLSSDKGTSWQPKQTPGNVDFSAIEVTPEGKIWIVGKEGIVLHSNDKGQSWQRIEIGTFSDFFDVQCDSTGEKIWICGDKVLAYSHDSGTTWHHPYIPPKKQFRSLAVNQQQVWCLGETGDLYYSVNAGENWLLHFVSQDQGQQLCYDSSQNTLWLCGRSQSKTIAGHAKPIFSQLWLHHQGSATARLGDNISYALEIQNTGNITAQNVVVTYQYPQEIMAFSHTSPSIERTDTEKLRWNLGNIPAGETKNFAVVMNSRKAGLGQLTAEVILDDKIQQSVTVETEVTKPIPEHWPIDLWEKYWDEKNEWIDFTVEDWVKSPHEDQVKFARAYQEWYAKEKKLELTRTIEKNGVEFVFKLIPPGKFWMGSPENEKNRNKDKIQHKVILSQPYWIGETEVTQRQWRAITGNNPAHFQESGLDAPVENISWEDCEKYSKEQGWQMPTEAQWEYACRGGTTTAYSFGEWDKNKLNSASYWAKQDLMSYEQWGEFGFLDKWQELGAKTLPVKNFVANSFGLYDMHGNVWEWCQDRYSEYPKEEVKDPLGAKEGSWFVLRGGSWINPAADCRSANRFRLNPGYSFSSLGVRFSLSSRSGK